MALTDLERLDKERNQPRLLALHFALPRLRSTVSFMNSGAHPDDETSAMLAALGFRDGLDLSYVCANRGEGGQNDIGHENLSVLGTLRTAEMEAAADALNLRLYWLSESPEDSIYDFGFSKNGEATLDIWGYRRTLGRFVHVLRRERPDILCPTFLDVPGQHGHHRAMTSLAHTAVEKAADANYNGSALDPWQVKKLYLPAWGGGGYAYDDEQAPPTATVHVKARGQDDISGWSWENIAQFSRRFHRSQNMGRWVKPENERNWPLHLVKSVVEESGESITSGLPESLLQLAEFSKAPQLSDSLAAADNAISNALKSFPNTDEVAKSASEALHWIRIAQEECPQHAAAEVQHRLQRKEEQLAEVLKLAIGVKVHASLATTFWTPGSSADVTLEVQPGNSVAQVDTSLVALAPWRVSGTTLCLEEGASASNPYPDEYLPFKPQGPVIEITIKYAGISSTTTQALDPVPVILPETRASLQPESFLVNTSKPTPELVFHVRQPDRENGLVQVKLPEKWQIGTADDQFKLQPHSQLQTGLYQLPVSVDGQPASHFTHIEYPHIAPRGYYKPTVLHVRALDIQLPNVTIAYIGGGNDSVAYGLQSMGLNVITISEEQLQDVKTFHNVLQEVDTLVIGVFAYRSNPDLAAVGPAINSWVENGGHLLTLYHRPWDNWDPGKTPPAFLEIGQPSLRYRITNESAEVTHLLPGHALLNEPNRIGKADWDNWDKERGLYFAKSWDPAYEALLSMADPDEDPHLGAILCAKIGKGRHVHTSLILHHQMNKLVPGSFRLMANLVS